MFPFLLITALIFFIVYKLFPYFLRWFIAKKRRDFIKQMGNQSKKNKEENNFQSKANNTSATEHKLFSKDEGEYIDFEEIK